MSAGNKPDADREFVLSRVIDAPRDLVWKAFTEPERLAQWWGPKGFKMMVSRMDLRPGGIYHYGLKAPDGSDMWGRFAYREIVKPEKIVWVNSFSDEKGGVARHAQHLEWPLELLSTLTFAEARGKTTLTLRWIPLKASESEIRTFDEGRDSMTMGWTGTFDQLAEYLAKA